CDFCAVNDVGTRSGERAGKGLIDADLDGLGLRASTQESDRQRDRGDNSRIPCHVVLQSRLVDPSSPNFAAPVSPEASIHHAAPSLPDERRPNQRAIRARKRPDTSDIPLRSTRAATTSSGDVPDSRRSRLAENSAINRVARSRTNAGLPTCASIPVSVYPIDRSTRVAAP